jgi:hypothetical protein
LIRTCANVSAKSFCVVGVLRLEKLVALLQLVVFLHRVEVDRPHQIELPRHLSDHLLQLVRVRRFDLGAFQLRPQNFLVRIRIGFERAQVELVALHHVLGEMLDLQLELRLANAERAALLLQLAETIARRAQLSFMRGHLFVLRRALGEQRRNFRFTRRALLGARSDRRVGVLRFVRLRGDTRAVARDVVAPGRDQFRQFGLSPEHRCALREQGFVFLLVRRQADA